MVEDNPDLTSPWGRVRLAVPAGWAVLHNNLFDVDPRTADLDDLDEDLLRAQRFGTNPNLGETDIRLDIGWFPNADRQGMYHMRLQEGDQEGRFVGRDLRILRAEVERWMHDPPESRRPVQNLERPWFDGDVWLRACFLDDIARGPLTADPRALTAEFHAEVEAAVRAWRERPSRDTAVGLLQVWLGNVIVDESAEAGPWIALRTADWQPSSVSAATATMNGLLDQACPQGKRAGMLLLGLLCHEPFTVFEVRGERPAVLALDGARAAVCLLA